MDINLCQEQNVVLSMPIPLMEETNHLAQDLGISYNDFYIFEFPVVDCGPWPENFSLRRDDMYDDWGR